MDERSIRAYAKRLGVNVDLIVRQKVMYIPTGAIPAGTQKKIFFQPDSELKNAIITNIRALLPSNDIAPILPGPITVANQGSYIQFVANFVRPDLKYQFTNIPMWEFIQDANINVSQGFDCLMRMVPEKCFLTYFDIGNVKGDVTFPLIFSYVPIIN